MAADRPPPVVLLGGERIAVSAARSLAQLGAPVYALGDRRDPIRFSRACERFVEVGSKGQVLDRYRAWLERSAPGGAVILPCDDEGIELIARHGHELRDRGLRPIEGDGAVMLAMLDKERTVRLAREAGVPAPRTACPSSVAEIAAIAAGLTYPCALKPISSHRFAAHFGVLKKVVIVAGPDELVREHGRLLELGLQMQITEVIPGGDDSFASFYSYIDEHGEPLFELTKSKLRGWPIGFGLTTYHITSWEPEVAALGRRFFRHAGLRGVGNVEFKHDARSGEWKIIECNHRFTAANDLIRHAGVDIPRLAYERAAGLPVSPVGPYRTGVRMWHPIEDVRALSQYRRAGELTTRRWLRSLMHRQHFPMWRAGDPAPTLYSLSLKAGSVLRGRG